MGKKTNLSKDLDDDEIMFINSKMYPPINKTDISQYVSSTKALKYKLNTKCKNQKQKDLLKLIREKDIVFIQGECGTGKSWISLSAALELLKEDNNYKRILIIAPTVEAGNLNIGFLKGGKDEKILPYLEADFYTITKILDESGNTGKACLNELLKFGYIEGDCVSFLRGKTIDNTIVVITEAENFSKQELFLILSRIGKSKYIFNGDNKQMDRKDLKGKGLENGLEYASRKLKDLDEVGVIEFNKDEIVRNPVITKIIDAWESTE